MKRIKCEHLFRILSLAIQDQAGSSCLMPGSRLFILPSYATRRRDRWPDSLASHHRSSHKSYLRNIFIYMHRCNKNINKVCLCEDIRYYDSWPPVPLLAPHTDGHSVPLLAPHTTHWWPLSQLSSRGMRFDKSGKSGKSRTGRCPRLGQQDQSDILLNNVI